MDKISRKSAAEKLKKAFAIVLSCSTLVWAMGVGAISLVALSATSASAAAATAHPNGVLVNIGDANNTIYLISGGKRMGIPSPTVFASHGYSFDKVVAANSFDKALEESGVMAYADSTLVRVRQEISLIGNGQKRGFTSAEVFTGLGYSFSGSNIVVPEDGYVTAYNAYATGTPIASATEVHPNGSLVNIDGVISQISNGQLVGIPSPEVFNSRGLNWNNVVTANAADKALTVASENMKFADGTLVLSAADNTTVYVISDGKKMGVTTQAALEAYGYSWSNLVKGDVSSYTEGALITDGTIPDVVVGTNAVSLATDTPAASTIARGAQDVEFAKYTFTAADETGYTISGMSITRGGISADTDLTAVELYIGTTRQGSAQALNTTTHKAVFTGLNIAVTKSAPKTVIVKGDVYSSASASNVVTLGIASAADITTGLTSSLSGTFPMYGANQTLATASVGAVTVDTLSTPAASNINSGSTEQQVASIKFIASATEALNVNSFKLTNGGTSGDADVSNIVVKYGATQLASVAGFSNNMATISLSPALSLNASASKTVDIYVNVAAGINTSRTVRLEITQSTDVSATGTSSNGVVTVSAAGTFPEQGAIHTISQGSLTTALDTSTNPSAQNYVKGTTSRDITALRMSTGSVEGVRVTQLKLTASGTATPTDVSNFSLWKDGVQISTGSITGTDASFTVQFGTNTTNSFDTPGLFDVAKPSNQVVVVKADVSSAATNARTIIMSVAAATDIKADGLDSKMDVPSASVTGTTTGSTLTIATSGSLTVSLNSASPVAATKGKGNTEVEFAKFDLTAGSGENILISSLTFRTYKDGTGTGTVAATGDITNMKLYDGTAVLGSTVANPTSGVASFSANLTVSAGTIKTLTVKGDIPTGTTASSLHVDLPGAGTIADDIASEGVSSGTSITETGSATGKLMTVATPSLVGAMSASPAASTKVVNSTGITIGKLLLTAGAGDDVKVSTIKIRFDDATALNSTSSANTELRNVKLYDGTTQLGDSNGGIMAATITDGTADYIQLTGITNLTVTKSQTKEIDVKADLVSGTTTYYCGIAAGDVTGSGVVSATSVSSTGTGYSAALTLAANGTMTATVDSSSPIAANIATGTNGIDGVEMAKYRFTTAYEPVKIKALTLTLSGGNIANFKKVKLYADGVQIGPDGYPSGSTVVFSFPTDGYYTVPADDYKIITVKADLYGVGTGVTHADAPILTINAAANITEEGGQSGASITDSGTFALTPAALYLYKTTATASLNTTLSGQDVDGGAATASATQVVMAVDITNNGTADLTVTSFDLTPSFSGTISGTAGVYLYWSTDLGTAITGGSGSVGTALTTGTKVTISPSANNTVSAGTTKTIVVKADTTGLGASATNTLHMDLAAVADLGWTPAGGSEVVARTKNLPITGATYTYAH